MKKFLIKILAFSLFSLVLFGVFLWVWGFVVPQGLRPNLVYPRGGVGHQFTRLVEAKKFGTAEVLVLGSSHAYRGFDPRIFAEHSLTLFNLGSSSQTPFQSLHLIQQYLGRFQPRLVVLEVYPGIFASDGVESALDLLANEQLESSLLLHSLRLGSLKVVLSSFFAMQEQVLNRRRPFPEDREKFGDRYITGGYVERIEDSYQSQGWTVQPLQVLPLQWDSFLEILSILEEYNLPFVMVRAPVSNSWLAKQTGWEQLEEQLRTLGPYYSWQETISWEDSLYFYDEHHLNQRGVEVFNKLLLEALIEDYPELF